MRLGVTLSLAAAALLLASSGSAWADNTYAIATTTSFTGTVSGSLTGTGNMLTGFDITAINGADTYVFNSSVGDTGSFSSAPGFTLSPAGPTLNVLDVSDGAGDYFELLVSGNFDSGLAPVESGEPVYYEGNDTNLGTGANVASTDNPYGGTSDDVSLTLQPTVAPTPEPSSLILMGTGLAGLCATLRRRLRS